MVHLRMLDSLICRGCDELVPALTCDQSHCLRTQLGRAFPSLGITEGHHTLSHHAGDKNKLDKIKKIDKHYMELFAGFLILSLLDQHGGQVVMRNRWI